MQLHQALKLLALLPADPAQALTVAQMVERWPGWDDMREDSKRHTMRRWLGELSDSWPVGGPGPVRKLHAEKGREVRYHRDRSALAALFMPVEVGMMLVTAGKVFNRALGPDAGFDVADLHPAAVQAIERAGQELANLLRGIRIVPDGIEREDARIDPEVLATTLEAISRGRQLRFDYQRKGAKWALRTVHPLGLVAKDGARYLFALPAAGNEIRQYAMHRMRDACVELDPLIADQRIEASAEGDWFRVSATVRETIQLVPFLLSMGPWAEVLAPASVRDEVADRAKGIAAHYP